MTEKEFEKKLEELWDHMNNPLAKDWYDLTWIINYIEDQHRNDYENRIMENNLKKFRDILNE